MTRISTVRGAPKTIRWTMGQSLSRRRWTDENGVTLDFNRRGKPTDNAFVESFNGCLRDECLNTHWVPVARRCPSQDRGLAARLQ
jgi:putative transposase